ncbi:MAG: lipocalin family protein [Saprospiraceae bacterium]|nr:lipocalin family protein [Saprospiraceae bacterium]
MKTSFSKFNLTALSLLLFVIPAITSCDKCKEKIEPTVKERLVGEWEITSFTIDGVEAKGSVILSSNMEFEAYTGSNGDFEWFIIYTDGSSETQTGDYEVDEEDREIELESNDGDRLKLEYELDGDDLELSGILDGERYVLKAERD